VRPILKENFGRQRAGWTES